MQCFAAKSEQCSFQSVESGFEQSRKAAEWQQALQLLQDIVRSHALHPSIVTYSAKKQVDVGCFSDFFCLQGTPKYIASYHVTMLFNLHPAHKQLDIVLDPLTLIDVFFSLGKITMVGKWVLF